MRSEDVPDELLDTAVTEYWNAERKKEHGMRAALAAAGYVVERGWQPIETAPRNGTRLLCFAPAAEDRASLVRSDFWWVRERAFAHMRPGQPYTHWRPLPTPPEGCKP